MMVKSSIFKSVCEHTVKAYDKSLDKSVETSVGKLLVLTWLLTLDESAKRVHLNAVTRYGLVSVWSTYPFRSVTNAYRYLVRL